MTKKYVGATGVEGKSFGIIQVRKDKVLQVRTGESVQVLQVKINVLVFEGLITYACIINGALKQAFLYFVFIHTNIR